MQDPPKFTQISIFGLKICHLATLFTITASLSSHLFVSKAAEQDVLEKGIKYLLST
jgi:hypothetical protein